MARWADVAAAEPELAERVRQLFQRHRHATLATLRRDGSPRISGIEIQFAGGDVTIGLMPGSVKSADLRRDPRLALHSASEDPPEGDPSTWVGDAKLAGRAVGVTDATASPHVRIDVTEVVLTRVGDPADHLVIESWHEDRGYQRRERR